MDNQHQKITGYRDLTQVEIDLMNKVKAKGKELQALANEIDAHLDASHQGPEFIQSEPYRWLSIARTDLQKGLMALGRAVARPTTF